MFNTFLSDLANVIISPKIAQGSFSIVRLESVLRGNALMRRLRSFVFQRSANSNEVHDEFKAK